MLASDVDNDDSSPVLSSHLTYDSCGSVAGPGAAATGCNDVVASHGGAFGTCSVVVAAAELLNDHQPRVHVTFDPVAAVAGVVGWPGAPPDSNWICQSHPHLRTRMCERQTQPPDRSFRTSDGNCRWTVRGVDAVAAAAAAVAAAEDAALSVDCCIVAPTGSRRYSRPNPD